MSKNRVTEISLKWISVVGIVVAMLVLAPLVLNLSTYIISLLITLLIYMTLAQSWNLVGGYAVQFNLGLAAYFGGGVLSYSLLYAAGVPFYLALLGGGTVSVVLAVIIGIPTLRLRGVYFAVGTLALAEALKIIVNNVFSASIYVPSSYWASYSLVKSYYLSLTLACLTLAIVYMVIHSPIGLALRALGDDEDTAEATGVNPAKYKLLVFVLSACLAGLAGGIFGYYRGIINPVDQFATMWTFGPVLAVFIGGFGTITGPIWGSVFFVVLEELLSRTVGQGHFIIAGILFILVILFLPGGLVEVGGRIHRFVIPPTRRKLGANHSP